MLITLRIQVVLNYDQWDISNTSKKEKLVLWGKYKAFLKFNLEMLRCE